MAKTIQEYTQMIVHSNGQLHSGSCDLDLKGVVRLVSPQVEVHANFSIKKDSRVALVGPSGVGKTTVLRMIAGLEPIDEGQILLAGSPVQLLPPEKRNIGYVPQGTPVIPTLDLIDNLACGLWFRGVKKDLARQQAREWLDRLGLGALVKGRTTAGVMQLSGGERQRLALGRAWIIKPSAFLLDEPFTGLDWQTKSEMIELLKRVHHDWPVPMMVVSHSQEDLDLLDVQKIQVKISEDGISREFLL